MKKFFKRLTAITLMAAMVVGIATGCGKSNNAATIDKNTIYKEEVLNIPFPEDGYVNSISVGDSGIFFVGYSYDPNTYGSEYYIGSCNADGTDFKKAVLQPESNDMYIDNIIEVKDGQALISYSEYFEDDSDPDNYIWESYVYLAWIDSDGKILSKIDLMSEAGINYIENVIVQDDGSYIIYSSNCFYKLDANGKLLLKKEVPNNIYVNTCFGIKNGSICVAYWSDTGLAIKNLDMNTLELGEEINLPFDISNYSVMSGNRDYDILLRTSGSIYGYNIGDSALKEIINMVNSDINTTYFACFTQMEDGSYIGFYTDYSEDKSSCVLAKYTKIDPKDYVEKEILVLGAVYINSNVRKEVIKFNKTNEKYRITIKDYSIYNTDDNYEAGYEKLNSDIASGQAPDIVVSSYYRNVKDYAKKGLFVDLHKFLDNDADITKDDIWPNLIEASEYDGKLYQVAPSFYVETMVAKKSKLGDKTGWTIDEMKAYEDTLPAGTTLFEGTFSRESFINMMLYIQAEDFIDTSKATCDFDSEEFKSILRYAADLPTLDEITYDDNFYNDYSSLWRNDKVILYSWYLSEPSSYREMRQGYIGEDITVIGYPTKDGSNGSLMAYDTAYSISSKSKHQDAAWDFVKIFWSEDYQKNISSGIPASKSQFIKSCEKYMERASYTNNETGETVYIDDTMWFGDAEITMQPLTQADVDFLCSYVSTVTKTMGQVDDDIITIINDEAASYFSGQKSVDEVTTIIQNRISTYLKERQ